jgi:ribosomal protein S16
MHILLSSEVGSEGLDMQFCNSMVNYDLPWNPMVVEQRIGRIDRFGQKSPVVNIYNIVVADSIQEEIYVRLLERIGIFRGTIGDLEAILDAEVPINGQKMTIQDAYNKMEKEFFTKDLTQAEKECKIAEVERAIENEKENLMHLQEGLSNTLTNDAYFRDEINRILYNNAYVTEIELRNYVQSLIRQYLTTCNLEEVDKDILEFRLPMSQPAVLRSFLTQYGNLSNDESTISVNQFKRIIDDKQSFRLTFSQQVAYDNPAINYLNIYHPLIQACLNYFLKFDDENKTSFSYALKADEILHEGDRYYMGLYQLTSHRMVQGQKKSSAEMLPVVYNLQTQKIEDNQDIIDRIFRRSQVEGLEKNVSNDDIQPDVIDYMSYDFAELVSTERNNRQAAEQRQLESDRLRNTQQTNEYYATRIAEIEEKIRDDNWNLEWISSDDKKERTTISRRIQLNKNRIGMLNRERDERLAIINEDKELSIDDKLVSLNIVTII